MNTTTAPAALILPTADAPLTAILGNGQAIHLADDQGILCNRWGTVNGVWKPVQLLGADPSHATCKRCLKINAAR